MRRTFAILTLLFLVSLFAGPSIAIQNRQHSLPNPLYQPNGKEASLVGSIFVEGKIPEALKYDMSADPVCENLNRPEARTDDLLVTNQGLINAFVYVKSGAVLNGFRFEVPASEAVLERRACRFTPHVLGVQVGQKVALVNSDPTVHNTHPTPRINPEWNMSQAQGAPPHLTIFPRPEQFIPVKCNHHPWERAFLGVFAHPFFAISDQLGNYEIRGLPAGTYQLVVWHEKLGEKEVELTVTPGENKRLDFTFDASKVRRIEAGSSQIGVTPQRP